MNSGNQTTRELIDRLVRSGLVADKNLVEEITKKEDAPDLLLDILKEDRFWDGTEGDGWAPIHALFALGLIGNEKAFEAVKYAFTHRTEALGDWICEDAPKILFAFGERFFGKISEIALDTAADTYLRLSAVDALCAMSIKNKELAPKTLEIFKKILEDGNDTLIGLALPSLAEVKNEALFEEVKKAYESTPFAKKVTHPEDLQELHDGTSPMPEYPKNTASLWNHFSKQNLFRFHEKSRDGTPIVVGNDGKKHKVGRNEPCPCGSGKKYKKCCLSEIQQSATETQPNTEKPAPMQRSSENRRATPKILQLKISLKRTRPSIWRRVLVEDSDSFEQLHETIQTFMGWENYHLYQFDLLGLEIGPPEDDPEGRITDSKKVKLYELLKNENQKLDYTYDFGDCWEHAIVVEKILEKDKSKKYPACIDGKRACPPEDCGGTWGYEELLEIRKNKKHPEYKERIVEWLGEDFDPEYFDLEEINEML